MREHRFGAPDTIPLPDLLEVQLKSFRHFLEHGMREVLSSVLIEDFTGRMALMFPDVYVGEPVCSEREALERNSTYRVPVRVRARLMVRDTGELREQDVYVGDIPLMTPRGTFIINGTERVIVSQLVRSPGVYYEQVKDSQGRPLFKGLILPARGVWLELEMDHTGITFFRVDRARKVFASVFLKALGLGDQLRELDHRFVRATLEREQTETREDALIELYRKLRPGEPPSVESAEAMLRSYFFDQRRYDLLRVGRYKLNKKLGTSIPESVRTLLPEDVWNAYVYFLGLSDGKGSVDDIDHLANRRVRTVGEQLEQAFYAGIQRLEKRLREQMSVLDVETLTPATLLANTKPLISAIMELCTQSQLSQVIDNTNPLTELTHKRRLSALGPGGLHKQRAGFEVRDVHHSHYGRMCPIETPEGATIGLLSSLATYARINEYGFIETPYRKVDKATGRVTDEIVYLTADEEERCVIAQSTVPLDESGRFREPMVIARVGGTVTQVPAEQVDYMDVSPRQIVSVATALIPFLENDDASRASMGANMQRQAVPLVQPEAPIVGTGLEELVARQSSVLARRDGEVIDATGEHVLIRADDGTVDRYEVTKFQRTNDKQFNSQTPAVHIGDRVKAGDPVIYSRSVADGRLALGRNLLVAYMPWHGYNYEDAIILSERVIKEDLLTSVHIEEHVCVVRETKLGPEEITRDIPNVGEAALRDLDENGIVRVGAFVQPGSILVGKVTPKQESDLSGEERLIQTVFNLRASHLKDTSKRLPHGQWGQVIAVQRLSRAAGDELDTGVLEMVRVWVAQKRQIKPGDKMAGRHGNKGVVSIILPVADMPYLPDGTPIDVILNPLGVPSRMNIGQILETHLGLAAYKLGIRVITPAFDGATREDVRAMLRAAGLPEDGKTILYDGRTGKPFDNPVTVGVSYLLVLHHQVDDKMHARSTGKYSLVTQQPLGGKTQFGGQRFGEMEVWALEGYGAAHTLQEILTVKSDDVEGRVRVYEAIVRGGEIPEPGIPESFRVLTRELRGMGLSVRLEGLEEEKEEPETNPFLRFAAARDEESARANGAAGRSAGAFLPLADDADDAEEAEEAEEEADDPGVNDADEDEIPDGADPEEEALTGEGGETEPLTESWDEDLAD